MIVTILFSYAITIGTTFNGILSPGFHNLTLILITLTVAGWLFVRWRSGWVWHRTPLDGVFILWIAAFLISLLANTESWRRIAIGLWYVSAYIGVWYMLSDVISNDGMKRDMLVDGLLICGIAVLIFGYFQARNWFFVTLPLIGEGLLPFSLPRPVSLLGNPNALGNFLVVLIPFPLTRMVYARGRMTRIGMGLYAVLTIFLLFLTYSRGAWLGLGLGIFVWLLLLLLQNGLLSASRLRGWWQKQNDGMKILTAGLSLVIIIGFAAGLLIFLRSFSEGGRGTDLRTSIYGHALTLFTEKPITGHGLFTFGRGFSRLESIPPVTPHSHAHNVVLHIAAELGVIGLAALFTTVAVIFWMARRNWRDSNARGRTTLVGAISAVVAFGVHQLTDIPAMTPAVALAGLVALALVMIPVHAVSVQTTWLKAGHPIAVAGLWLLLLVTGFWSSAQYQQYVDALQYASQTRDFRGAAARLQSIIDADPGLPLYDKEQGLLLGLAAYEGDVDAARQGVEVYERFLSREPGYAIAWANLAALQWQLGEREAGVEAMRRAVELAPESWQLAVNLANYEQGLGNRDAANAAYDHVIKIYPDAVLFPDLPELSVRQLISSTQNQLSVPGQVVQLLNNGQLQFAQQAWAENPQPGSTIKYVIDALLALAEDNRTAAEDALAKAARVAGSALDDAWLGVGRARLARFDGDDAEAERQLEGVHTALTKDTLDGDFRDGLSIAYAQFLRIGIPRQFLPQLYYSTSDPVLINLLENT